MADSSDFMLNEEDDFKPQGSSGFEEVDGADIFADASKKEEEPESKAFDDIDGSDIFGDGDKEEEKVQEEKVEEPAQEVTTEVAAPQEVAAEKEEVLKFSVIADLTTYIAFNLLCKTSRVLNCFLTSCLFHFSFTVVEK